MNDQQATTTSQLDPKLVAELKAREIELVEREQQLVRDLQQPHNPNWVEDASERENDEVMAALLDQTRAELAKIRATLLSIAEHAKP